MLGDVVIPFQRSVLPLVECCFSFSARASSSACLVPSGGHLDYSQTTSNSGSYDFLCDIVIYFSFEFLVFVRVGFHLLCVCLKKGFTM